MFQLRYGYLVTGILIGFILLWNFASTFPDGKLHIVFCNVGQGDGAYITFPDGRDMLVDGGPDDKIINCLSRHMPFWDRHIDIVLNTHPQKDHLQGLIGVLSRYAVDYFIKSDIGMATDGYRALMAEIAAKKIPIKLVTSGQKISAGSTTLSFLWPSQTALNVLGATTNPNVNDGCLVFWLRYGTFDALLPGDADASVEPYYTGDMRVNDGIEVLKVPHHGSKTGMTRGFVDWVHPKLAVISVGKNTFGHPSPESIALLESVGARVMRTDKDGDIEVVSDGKSWGIDK